MSEPLRLDPGARVGNQLFDTVDPRLWSWTCPACGTTYQRLSADGLVPNPGGAKALCDSCRAEAEGR